MFSKKFISATMEYCTHEKFIAAPLFRRTFVLKNIPKFAKVTICGLGFYKLFVNGKEITKGYFAPYQSNPDHLLYYDCYDVTELLLPSENVLGVMLGNGFLNCIGGQVWEFDQAPYRSAPKLALAFETENGVMFEADDCFKTYPSAIIFDDFREGEHYDARLEEDRWAEIGYDDSAWHSIIETIAPLGEPTFSTAPTLQVAEEILPSKVHVFQDGYIYDFGKNTSGFTRLKLKEAEKGQVLRFTYFERLGDDDGPYIDNIRFLNGRTREGFCQQMQYTCKAGAQTYQPSFTWCGYRYVYIQGLTKKQVEDLHIIALDIHADVKIRGGFSCSNSLVNQINDIILRSDITNLFHYPVDCPHREKNGWTADSALSCEQMLLQMNIEDVFTEWLKNIRKAQNENGAIPGIIPTGGWGYEWGNGPAWDCALFWLPYQIYQYRGDKKILQDNVFAIEKYLAYMRTKRNENGLLAYGLGDWCQSFIWDCGSFETPLEITDSLIGYDLCKKAAAIFSVLGNSVSQRNAEKLSNELLESFRKKWISEDGTSIKSQTQTAQALALKSGVFFPEKKKQATDELVSRIARDGNRFNVGVVGGYALFTTLADNGHVELAYKLITQKTPPSYGYIASLGETTLWEIMYDFGESKSKVTLKGGERIISMNHHFWGFAYSFFVHYVAGLRINPQFTDVQYIEIIPNFIEEITHAEAYYDMDLGRVSVKWERVNQERKVQICIPEGIKAKIIVDNQVEFLSGGKYTKIYKLT